MYKTIPFFSVPDPDQQDPNVFGTPGFASGSGFFDQQAKKRKTLISTILWLLYVFLSLKNYVNVPSKRNKHKHLEKTNYILLTSWRSLTKRAGSGAEPDPHPDPLVKGTDPRIRIRIRIRIKISRIRNTAIFTHHVLYCIKSNTWAISRLRLVYVGLSIPRLFLARS